MRKKKMIRTIVYFLVFSLPLLYTYSFWGNVFAASVVPVYYTGNDKDLPAEVRSLPSVKFDPPVNGTKTLDGNSVTAEFSADKMSVSFISDVPIAYVFVKAGPGGYLYTYNPPVLSDNDLISPP